MAITVSVIKRDLNIKTKIPPQKKNILTYTVIVIRQTDDRELRPTATAELPLAGIIGIGTTCIFTVVVRKRNGKTASDYDF